MTFFFKKKTENTLSKNELFYKKSLLLRKYGSKRLYLEKKCDFKIGCQIDTNLFVYCREITCFSFKPKILVPNYLDKKMGKQLLQILLMFGFHVFIV